MGRNWSEYEDGLPSTSLLTKQWTVTECELLWMMDVWSDNTGYRLYKHGTLVLRGTLDNGDLRIAIKEGL